MIINYITKIANLVLSFLSVRLLLSYLGSTNYGLWTTILSVFSWLSIGDFGIANGLRNKLTEAFAKKDKQKARGYITTAYIYMFFISIIIFIASLIIATTIIFINKYSFQFIIIIYIMIIGSALNFVFNIIGTILYASNESGIVGVANLLNSLLFCLLILLFRQIANSNIIMVSIIYNISLLLINLIISYKYFFKHKELLPRKRYFHKKYARDILELGIKFFILQICGIILFATDNFIISMVINVESVTKYSLIDKVYSNINNLYSIILVPVWSAMTYTYALKDIKWIKSITRKLHLLLVPMAFILIGVSFFFNDIIKIWIGKPIDYNLTIIILFATYSFMGAWLGIYCALLNGFGRVNIQMILAIIGAIVNIPLSIYLAKNIGLGILGVKLATFSTQLLQAIILPIEYRIVIARLKSEEDNNESSAYNN
jgi:O-antigen/teichoic acid export membrane protein